MTIDPRLLERRKVVAEDRAMRNVGRLLWFLVVGALIGGMVWLAASPWLSVAQVRTTGIEASDTHQTLARSGVVAGTPMILIRPSRVEQLLEQDPWIRDARVYLDWPDEVIVRVEERVPVAWIQTAAGWSRRAADGVAVPGPTTPDDRLPRIYLPDVAELAAEQSPLLRGAAEFAASLPSDLRQGTSVFLESGELWAEVDGFQVRLGRPVEMSSKALTLAALLTEAIEPESTLVLVAPTHPAVQPPTTTTGESRP